MFAKRSVPPVSDIQPSCRSPSKMIEDRTAKYMSLDESRSLRGYAEGGLIHPQNAKFFQGFHNYVVDNNLQGTDDQGRDVTMYITGIEYKGKEYLLPAYDPDTKKVITDNRALLEKYKPLIESGKIDGYDSPKEAEQDRMIFYPQIVGGEEYPNTRSRNSHGGKVLAACKS